MVSQNRAVEVFVVDTHKAVGMALGARRSDAESTHVLCRHGDEADSDFMHRVQRRIARIQRSRRVRALWYVVGAEAARSRPSPLLHALAGLLGSDASLTVVGPGKLGRVVFEWLDTLREWRDGEVTLRAQLYTDDEPPRIPLWRSRVASPQRPVNGARSLLPIRQLPIQHFSSERLAF